MGQTQISRLEQTDYANLFLNWPLKLAEYVCLSYYSKIIATSNFIMNELKTCFPFIASKDISVIHNGVDTTFFRTVNDFGNGRIAKLRAINRPIVLFTGRFVASKGIYTLVKAIPRVVKDYSDVMFVFTGGGDYSHYFNSLKQEILKNNCSFLGYLPRLDMPKVYSLASIYVMPTLYESFPLRLLESMACENAVIASRVCGIPEVIQSGENGFLIPPKDSQSLAETIRTLLEDPHLLWKIGTKARNTILDGFSARIMAEKTFDIYNKL
jgi:glycosyltransferase involved in cell wall biosynthesis